MNKKGGCLHLQLSCIACDADTQPALLQRTGCKTWVWLAGSPLELVQPDTLRWKVMEPVLLLGKHRFEAVDIRIRVKGGGNVSQIYGAPPQHTVSLKQPACCPECWWSGATPMLALLSTLLMTWPAVSNSG